MTHRRGGIAGGLLAALVAMPAVARADGQPDEKQACLSAAEQGQTQRDDGLYRAARSSFVQCARDTCPKLVVQSCTRWLRELDQEAPTVVLGAKDDRGNDLTDVTVSLDGTPFATVLDGKPVESDAGEHVLRFERDGSLPVEQKLVLRAGERARVVTVTFRSINAPIGGAPEPTKPLTPDAYQAPEALFSPHHVAAGAFALGGMAAAGTGIVFIVLSNQHKDRAANLRTNLSPDSCAHSTSVTCRSLSDEVSSQHLEMNVATGLFVGAGVFAAAAVVTWLVWPQSAPAHPPATGGITTVPGGAVLQMVGAF